MDNIYRQIETIIANARKSIGKVYTSDTLLSKRKEIVVLEAETVKILEDPKILDSVRQTNVEKFNKLKNEALQVLTLHEDKSQQSSTQRTKDNRLEGTSSIHNKMTNNYLSTTELAAISKLIPTFNGIREELEIFLANLSII